MGPLDDSKHGNAVDSPTYRLAEAKKATVHRLVAAATRDLMMFHSADIRMEIMRWRIWAENDNDYFDKNPIPWNVLYEFAQNSSSENDHETLMRICPEYREYVDNLGIEADSGVRPMIDETAFGDEEALSLRRADTLSAVQAVQVFRRSRSGGSNGRSGSGSR
jgi:hypothetical protein